MVPFGNMSPETAGKLRYILHDIDDTITNDGKLTAEAYSAMWQLHDAGLRVVPVTGRPGGWCDMAIRQWPIDAIVGENGAFVCYWKDGRPAIFRHPSIPGEEVRQRLDAVRDACLRGVPGCRVARDQFARIYDVAIDFHEDPPYLSLEEAARDQGFRLYDLAIDFAEDEPRLGFEAARRIQDIAQSMGAVAKISSIHVNIWFGDYDKVSMARLFFETVWGVRDFHQSVLFFGDSANDEPMFAELPQSCGVANVAPFLELMEHHPAYVTRGAGGYGFAEAAEELLRKRGR